MRSSVNGDSSDSAGTSGYSIYCTNGRQQRQKPPPKRDTVSFATLKRVRKDLNGRGDDCNLPYNKLEDSAVSIDDISLNLSRESLRQSCETTDFDDDDLFASNYSASSAGDDEPSSEFAQTTSQDGPAEAINQLLLEKIEKQIASFETDPTPQNSPQVLRRVGAYCTLRRDKLVHLPLTALRAVVSKRMRQSHEPESSAATAANSTLQLLRELEGAVVDDESDVGSTMDPDKIEECLLELDAYLDQMDTAGASATSHVQALNSLTSLHTSSEFSGDNDDGVAGGASFLPDLSHDKAKLLPDDDDGFNYRTTENAGVNSVTKSNLGDESHCAAAERQIRSEPMAMTFDGAPATGGGQLTRSHPNRSTASLGRSQTRNFDPASGHHDNSLPWRRRSMRRTLPISLPDQSDQLHSVVIAPPQHTRDSHHDDATNSAELPPRYADTLPNPFQQVPLQRQSAKSNPHLDGRSTAEPCSLSTTFLDTFSGPPVDRASSTTSTSEDETLRPRQRGRRADDTPRLVSIRAESCGQGERRIIINRETPDCLRAGTGVSISMPPLHRQSSSAVNSSRTQSGLMDANRGTVGMPCVGRSHSEQTSIVSSRNPSPVSLISVQSSSGSSSGASTVETNTNRTQQRPQTDTAASSNNQDGSSEKPKSWPYEYSRMFAIICCTLGIFNISRFAIFSIHYGANFIVQFIMLSFVFGIPMLWFLMALGSKCRSGPITMWKISPISKGIGISLVLAQGAMALYSALSLSWLFVYFRDSLMYEGRYKWQDSLDLYRGNTNDSHGKLPETIADYFNGVVLQRFQLGPGGRAGASGIGAVRFQLAFNLAMVWGLVFIVLSKGLSSYGKIVIGLVVVPITMLFAVSIKFISLIGANDIQNLFPATDWQDFFLNTQSWASAAQESFLTWALLGGSVISMSSRSPRNPDNKKSLRRDALVVAFVTLFVLILAAILGNSCVQILLDQGYYYFPGSYESMTTYVSLLPTSAPLPPRLASMPTKWLRRYSMLMGDSFYHLDMNPTRESGYQAIRLITDLLPAALGASSISNMPPIWSFLGFTSMIFFGIAQLCAIWKPIANIVGNSTSSVLLSCVSGLLLGIPMATESGITIIHYFDSLFGGAWWLLVLWFCFLFAIFLIRGRPYSADLLVNDLKLTQTLSAFLALSWNVLLPVGFVTLSIINYKDSNSKDFFQWRGSGYWPLWARKVGGFVQLFFLLLVPIVAIIQIYRYLTKGPPDVLDRIQLLYRPGTTTTSHHRTQPQSEDLTQPQPPFTTRISLNADTVQDDAPPKYTPPPSYTTATGARIAKMLRNSIRRSVRRILGDTSSNRTQRPCLNTSMLGPPSDDSLPPAYSTVLTDPSGEAPRTSSQLHVEMGPRVLYNSATQRSFTLQRNRHRLIVPQPQPQEPPQLTSSLTAHDVATLLRPNRNSFHRTASLNGCVDSVLKASLRQGLCRSVENLVLNAAPIGDSSFMNLASGGSDDNESNPNKSFETSVI